MVEPLVERALAVGVRLERRLQLRLLVRRAGEGDEAVVEPLVGRRRLKLEVVHHARLRVDAAAERALPRRLVVNVEADHEVEARRVRHLGLLGRVAFGRRREARGARLRRLFGVGGVAGERRLERLRLRRRAREAVQHDARVRDGVDRPHRVGDERHHQIVGDGLPLAQELGRLRARRWLLALDLLRARCGGDGGVHDLVRHHHAEGERLGELLRDGRLAGEGTPHHRELQRRLGERRRRRRRRGGRRHLDQRQHHPPDHRRAVALEGQHRRRVVAGREDRREVVGERRGGEGIRRPLRSLCEVLVDIRFDDELHLLGGVAGGRRRAVGGGRRAEGDLVEGDAGDEEGHPLAEHLGEEGSGVRG